MEDGAAAATTSPAAAARRVRAKPLLPPRPVEANAATSAPKPAAAAAASFAATASNGSASLAAQAAAGAAFDFGPHSGSQVASVLRKVFGHPSLRDTQARAASAVLRQRDCLVLAPTGGGKSLCYQLPATLLAQQKPGMVTLVVSPLIALMQDQVAFLRKKGVHAAMLGSAVSEAEKKLVMAELAAPLGAPPPNAPPIPVQATEDSDDLNAIPADELERRERWEARQFNEGVPPPQQPPNFARKVSPPRSAAAAAASAAAAAATPSFRRQRLSLLYVSPELLCGSFGRDLLARLMREGRVPFVAIDEVHCVSQWGHDFRGSFLQLSFLKREYPTLPLLLLTATATKQVQGDILKVLGIARSRVDLVRQSFNRPNVAYSVVHKETIRTLEGEDMTLFKHMARFIQQHIGGGGGAAAPNQALPAVAGQKGFAHASAAPTPPAASAPSGTLSASASSWAVSGSGIIYCAKREETHEVAAQLRGLRITAAPYHAGLPAAERAKVQQDWMNNKIACICATTAFGMGIDKSDVRFVIHFQLPSSIEAYYQASGRAGRDGRPSAALLYYSQDDVRRAQFLARQEQPYSSSSAAGEEKEGATSGSSAKSALQTTASIEHRLALLEAQVEYCEARSCRRQVLLKYFDEFLLESSPVLTAARAAKRCCDVCADPKHAEQSLLLAKAFASGRGVAGARGGASMAPLKGEAFVGARSGEGGGGGGGAGGGGRFGPDEYEEAYEETPLQKARAQEAAAARKAAAQAEGLLLPRAIATDKSGKGLDRLIAHLEAEEKRAERAQGIERRTKLVPFASLSKGPAGAVAGQKRGRAYRGPLLGVDSESHAIKDLALAKREQFLDTLTKALKANFALPTAAAVADDVAATNAAVPLASAASTAAALEWRTFSSSFSASSYTGAMRGLCMSVSADTRNKQRFKGADGIDRTKLPRSGADSDSDSDSEEGSGSSDEDDSDGSDDSGDEAKQPRRPASTAGAAAAGGFITASSLKGTAAPAAASSKPAGIAAPLSPAGAFQSASAALKVQPVSTAATGAASARPSSTNFSPVTNGSKLSSSSSPAVPVKQPLLRNYFAPREAAFPRTPPRAAGKPKATLTLSYVGSNGSGNKPSSPPMTSPSRTGALQLTPASSSSKAASACAASADGSPARKKPRLDLTTSP